MTKNYIESLENIAANYDRTKDNIAFMKDQIIEFKDEDKVYINFKECNVAICPNGGLIAICKKKDYLDITKGSKVNDNIIVMHQNSKYKYYIRIEWQYKQKYFILFDFNYKEQLYGICNDGSIFKIDILLQRAIPKYSSEIFLEENISKAKLYEDGFIALTLQGNFYYVKDIKNPIPELFFQMKSLLHFSINIEFLIIPASVSKSGNIELLITNEKGHGAIHVEKMEDARYYILPKDEDSQVFIYKGISTIKKDILEPYVLGEEIISNEKNLEKKQDTQYLHDNLRKIVAFAISPSKKNIALYDTRGYVFFFDSKFDIKKYPRVKAQIDLSKDLTTNEIMEQQLVMNYGQGFQFLFCGEESVILYGLRLIFIVHKSDHVIKYKITDYNENDALKGKLFCKCITEMDGVRFLTNEGIYFISQISKDLYDICDPFSNSYSKQLIQAYQYHIDKSVNSEKALRDIGNHLIKSINSLLFAAANIFWTENSPEDQNYEKKDVQLFILKAAQYGKNFAQKDEFNYDKFYEICKDIRCVNNLRNHSNRPKLITYNEYKNLEPKDLIKKLMRNLNFGMAFEICHYLDYSDKRVYQRFAIDKIKQTSDKHDREEEKQIFIYLDDKLKNVKNLSFIKLAKKAFKYHKNYIGMKFLENEKSALSKIPQYIELCQWDKALDFAENFYDSNIINTVLYKLYKKEKVENFIDIIINHPKAKNATIYFLRNNDSKVIENYLKKNKNPEELFFYYLEEYFQSNSISEREKCLTHAKENLNLIDNNVNPEFEHKFYKNYLESLENNIKIKNDSKNKNIISNPDYTSFDISIYDFYKIGITKIIDEKDNTIEKYNKSFGLSQEAMGMMKLMTLLEQKRIRDVEAILNKYNNNVKKIGLTNLNAAEIFYKFKNYRKAFEFIKLIKEPKYTDYKINMLEYINDFKGVLEVIISDKTIVNMTELVENFINKKPELLNIANELYEKYKIKFK